MTCNLKHETPIFKVCEILFYVGYTYNNDVEEQRRDTNIKKENKRRNSKKIQERPTRGWLKELEKEIKKFLIL